MTGNGNVIRKHKKSNYTVIDNSIFKNKRLSLKSKGLLGMLLSLPENWEFSESGLTVLSSDGLASVRSGLKELEQLGYLIRERSRNDKGHLDKTIYHIYESPICDFPILEKPILEKPILDNQHNKVLINKELKNKVLNNKEKYKKEKYFDDEKVNELFLEFLEMRKKLKAVNNERAITLLLNKLSKYNDITKYKMIENSIMNSWKSVYELKGNFKNNTDTELPEWFDNELTKNQNDLASAKMEELLKEIRI